MKKKRKKEVSVRSTYCRFSLAFLCLVPTPACGNLQGLPPHSQSGFLSCFAGAPMIGLFRDLQWGGLCFEFCGPTPVPLRGLFFRRLTQPRARAISLISTRRTPFLDWHFPFPEPHPRPATSGCGRNCSTSMASLESPSSGCSAKLKIPHSPESSPRDSRQMEHRSVATCLCCRFYS